MRYLNSQPVAFVAVSLFGLGLPHTRMTIAGRWRLLSRRAAAGL
jgi:hypothetical protein